MPRVECQECCCVTFSLLALGMRHALGQAVDGRGFLCSALRRGMQLPHPLPRRHHLLRLGRLRVQLRVHPWVGVSRQGRVLLPARPQDGDVPDRRPRGLPQRVHRMPARRRGRLLRPTGRHDRLAGGGRALPRPRVGRERVQPEADVGRRPPARSSLLRGGWDTPRPTSATSRNRCECSSLQR
jgi:hypothetical protein